MSLDHIKSFIKNELLRKDWKLNTKRIEKNGRWLKNNFNQEYLEILER